MILQWSLVFFTWLLLVATAPVGGFQATGVQSIALNSIEAAGWYGHSTASAGCTNRFQTSLFAKKKKKKKKSRVAGADDATSDSSATPRRVSTSDSTVSVKQQIEWAKAYKRLTEGSSKYSIGKKFRRQKVAKNTTIEEEEYELVDYSNMKPPAVFVDGYNIIGHINMVEQRNIDLDEARTSLINDLAVLRGATGWWIEVVFDAYNSEASAARQSRIEVQDSLLVTYTSRDETADTYIESRFQQLKNDGFINMIVATDDRALQMVAGSTASGFMSADILHQEIKIAYSSWRVMQRENEEAAAMEERKARSIGGQISSIDTDEIIKRLAEEQIANRNAAIERGETPKLKQKGKTISHLVADEEKAESTRKIARRRNLNRHMIEKHNMSGEQMGFGDKAPTFTLADGMSEDLKAVMELLKSKQKKK